MCPIPGRARWLLEHVCPGEQRCGSSNDVGDVATWLTGSLPFSSAYLIRENRLTGGKPTEATNRIGAAPRDHKRSCLLFIATARAPSRLCSQGMGWGGGMGSLAQGRRLCWVGWLLAWAGQQLLVLMAKKPISSCDEPAGDSGSSTDLRFLSVLALPTASACFRFCFGIWPSLRKKGGSDTVNFGLTHLVAAGRFWMS